MVLEGTEGSSGMWIMQISRASLTTAASKEGIFRHGQRERSGSSSEERQPPGSVMGGQERVNPPSLEGTRGKGTPEGQVPVTGKGETVERRCEDKDLLEAGLASQREGESCPELGSRECGLRK